MVKTNYADGPSRGFFTFCTSTSPSWRWPSSRLPVSLFVIWRLGRDVTDGRRGAGGVINRPPASVTRKLDAYGPSRRVQRRLLPKKCTGLGMGAWTWTLAPCVFIWNLYFPFPPPSLWVYAQAPTPVGYQRSMKIMNSWSLIWKIWIIHKIWIFFMI